MFPQPMPRSEFPTEGSHPDLTSTLEQHIHAGFQPDLALDLVLNELVVRAAEATNASSAALALSRGDELVCRAATGNFAPDLGVPLNPRDGLSGVCLRTHKAQLSVDAEVDPRVAAAFSRRFGIRSVLVVPVFDVDKVHFMGVLEVFSPAPAAFSSADQYLLEAYADECARVRQAADELSQPGHVVEMPPPTSSIPPRPKPAPITFELSTPILTPRILPAPEVTEPEIHPTQAVTSEPAAPEPPRPEMSAHEVTASEVMPPDFELPGSLPARESTYEGWTLILGALAILAIVGVSFVIGSRIGWFRAASVPPVAVAQPNAAAPPVTAPVKSAQSKSVEPKSVEPEAARTKTTPPKTTRTESRTATPPKSDGPAPEGGELVVYEKGKVVFRMKSQPGEPYPTSQSKTDPVESETDSKVAAASTPASAERTASTGSVWLNPAEAGNRLLNRIEPQYPAAARASRRAGDVVLEVDVAEDGSVSSIRTVKGDPVLAAAATTAVRNWRYQPYRIHDRPSPFHTDVTLSFSPNN